MKKVFIFAALTTASLLSADGYYSGCATCDKGGYQDSNYGWNNNNYRNNNYNGRRNQDYNQNSQYYRSGSNQDYKGANDYNQGNSRDRYSRDNQNDEGYYNQNMNNESNDNGYNRGNDRGYYNKGNGAGRYNSSNNQDNSSNNQDRNQDRRYNDGSQKQLSDQEIHQKIQDKIGSGWFSKGFEGVIFEVRNGQVMLRGNVDTLDDKNKVEDTVKKIDGVRNVNSQIRVAKEMGSDRYSDSDSRDYDKKYSQDYAATQQDRVINSKIRNKLGNGWFSKGYEGIVLKTTNGTVLIMGTVDKSDDLEKINEDIKAIEGVKAVNNQIQTMNNR